MDIKTTGATHDTSTNIFLTAAVVLANMDYSGLMDYAVKAAIGGVIWMGFKLTADWIAYKVNKKRKV